MVVNSFRQLDDYSQLLEELIPDAAPSGRGTQWKTQCVHKGCKSYGDMSKTHLHINNENGRGVCFRCGMSFSFTWFLQLLMGISKQEAVRYAFGDRTQRISRITVESILRPSQRREDIVPSIIPAMRLPNSFIPVRKHPYLSQRNISPEIAEKMDLHIGTDGEFRDRVVTPIQTQSGRCVGYSGRATYRNAYLPKRFSTDFPRNAFISNEQVWMKDNPGYLVLVEGELGDVASVMHVTPYVGSTFGIHLAVPQCVRLLSLGIKKVFLMWDGGVEDRPLWKAIFTLYHMGISVYISRIPNVEQDPGDLSPEAVRRVLRASKKVRKLDYEKTY